MPNILSAATAAIAVLGGLASALPASAANTPTRMPGLWETATITNAGRTVARECIDERTDRLIRQATAGVTCRNDDFNRTADGYLAGAVCRSGSMSIDNKVVVDGDFAAFARVDVTTVMVGLAGENGPRTFRTTLESRRLGDCLPDQRPGDVVLPNGTTINVPGVR